MKPVFFLAIFCLLSSLGTLAQDAPAEPPAQQSLDAAFEDLKAKANDYEAFKVIRRTNLNEFWKVVQDSLKETRQQQAAAQTEIAALNQRIAALEEEAALKDQQVAESQYMIDHLSVLGISVNKSGYVVFNFVLLIALVVIILMGYTRFSLSNKIAKQKVQEYDQLTSEYEDYRKKAKEREMKLRRDLQTCINKTEELKKNR